MNNSDNHSDCLDLSGATNNILGKYNSLTFFSNEEKYLFFTDFFELNKANWIRLNLNDAELIDYWKLIKTNKAVAKNIDYLIALKTSYNSPSFLIC